MELRKNLPPLPDRMRTLPVDERGYPIPWFVDTNPETGKRDFRIADGEKRVRAVNHRLCWLCGEKVGRNIAFVIGPMCAVNRNTSEPGCHLACAEFVVQACPFLMLPAAQYRTASLPGAVEQPPHGLPGNPGACCIWITETYRPYRVEHSWLIRVGDPVAVSWWAEGKPATRQAILDSFERRLPLLADMAREQGPEAEAHLRELVASTMLLLPAPPEQVAA